MATLTGNKVKDSYQSLLKLSSGGATSTIKTVEDGLGVETALKVGTDTVEVKSLKITNTPTVSSSENTVMVYDDATNEVKVRELNTSAFQSINSFSNIAVSGQTTVVADSGTDTLTLVAGSGMTITTDDTTDTVTFSSTGSTTLSSLTDTSISSVAPGDLLAYNGTDWVNDSTPRTVAFVDNTNAVNFATPNASGNILFEAGNNMSITYSGNTVSFAASGGSTQTYANPMFILRPQSIYSLTGTLASPTITGVNNNSNSSSYLINDSSNSHFQTSAVTLNAMTVVSEGLINIDVSFYFEVSTTNTTVEIALYEKPSGGSETLVQSISRDKVNTGISVVGFGLVRHVAADTDVYFKLRVTAGSAGLLTSSTFSVTKLD